MDDSYLVKGAKIKCLFGSEAGELGVEFRNICLLKIPMATEEDCEPGVNIPGFGICSYTGEPCEPLILGKWLCPHEKTKVNGASAITTDSGLVCGRGGVIVAETSGQETIAKVLAEFFKDSKDLYGFGCSPYSNDPVNLCTGNFVLESEDLVIKGTQPLTFTRTYNSLSQEDDGCGIGWSHNHNLYLAEQKEKVEIHLGEGGRVRTFVKTDQGYQTDEMVKESFTRQMDGYLYTDLVKRRYLFNQEGLCTEIRSQDGNVVRYSYHGKNLYKAQNLSGALFFQFDEDGRLNAEITPEGVHKVVNSFDSYGRTVKQEFPDGGVVQYEYDDSAGKLTMIQQNGSKINFYRDKWQRDRRITSASGQIEKIYNEKHQLEAVTDRNGNKTFYHHDEMGNIASSVDAQGNETRFEYDKNNHPIKVIFPDGSQYKTDYNLQGKVIKNTDPLGRSYEYRYHNTGMVETIVHPDGSEMNMEFDERGNVIRVGNPFGSKIQYKYDALNRVTAAIDGNGNRTEFSYNDKNDMIKMVNALGGTREYLYDPNGKIIKVVDEDGLFSEWEYNDIGHPVKKTDRQGRNTTLGYDQMWNVCRETKANGAVTECIYNRANLLEKVISPEGGETHYEYDKNGNCIKKTEADGACVKFHYDSLNRLIQTDYANGASSYAEYDFAGKMTKLVDARGGIYHMEYDPAGQKIREIMPGGKITCFEYNELGLLTKIIEPMNQITGYEYLSGGRLNRVIYPDGSDIEYSYDNNANIICKRGWSGYRIDFVYDALNRLVSAVSSLGQSKRFVYDAMGNLVSVTNSKGVETAYEYTGSGKLQAVFDPLGTKTSYEYDEIDQLILVKQTAGGLEEELDEVRKLNRQKERILTRYQRNLDGYVISSQNGAGDRTLYQRDFMGRVLTVTDPEGGDTHYSYDKMGNVKKILYPDGKRQQMEYDAIGQLIELEDWLGTTKILRNAAGNPEEIRDYQGNTMYYEWDCFGKRTKTVYPEGMEVCYQYQENQKLSEIRWDNGRIDYEYGKNGHLVRKNYSNGKHSSYGYHSDGRLRYLFHSCERGNLNYHYEYDVDGFPVTMEQETSEKRTFYRYRYDKLGRISEVLEDLSSVRKYEYDAFGNRVGKKEGREETGYQYNEKNQLIQETSEGWNRFYEYDKRGNIRSCYENEEVFESYFYNGRNLLERIVKREEGEVSYQYDGFGHHVRKQNRSFQPGFSIGGRVSERQETEFTIDLTRRDHNVIQESRGEEETCYVWEPHSHHLAGLLKGEKSYFYQNDSFGSPVRLLGSRGELAASSAYDEFGKRKSEVCFFGINQHFGFSGYYEEEGAGIYYAERRYYNPEIGLFYGEDLFGGNTAEPLTLHPYLFCWGNPLYYLDLDGAYPGAYTADEGTEADEFLKAYFKWYYTSFSSSCTPYTQVEIPNGSLIQGAEVGYCDLLLVAMGKAEIYEIKPDSHRGAFAHIWDKIQLQKYIDAYNLDRDNKWQAVPGTTFNPNGLLIPSEINPDYYIYYQTYYTESYTYPTTRGNSITDNYEGFIYWGYKKKSNVDEEEWRPYVWISNQDGKGGEHKNHHNSENNVLQFPNSDKAAATVLGGGAAFISFIQNFCGECYRAVLVYILSRMIIKNREKENG